MRSRTTLALTLLALGSLLSWLAARTAAEPAGKPLTEEDAVRLGTEAYVYGFPLVLMDVTRQVQTTNTKPADGKGPNRFMHSRKFPDHTFTAVVSPNADTLYSNAWLDLTKEPVVLSVPAMGKRYYLMQLLDAWTNTFACPGTRTTGSGKGDFAVVGPDWKGKLPEGVREIRSPTNMVWLIGRTQTNGPDDYKAVHAIQEHYRLTPLSAWNKKYTPPDVPIQAGVDAKTPPSRQVAAMDAATFFARLNALMKDNPPAAADAPVLARLAAVGVAPGKPFDLTALDPAVAAGLRRGPGVARERLTAAAKMVQGKGANGWDVARNFGTYGTKYPARAVVALFALGANLPEDALYPRTRTDADGKVLTGANRYVIHFPKGQLPPVNAFWSVTLYNSKQAFVENPIGRFAIGDRDRLKFDEDGSLTLYVQHESPGADKLSNWLPAPGDEFNLIMRLYWPKPEALDGTWKPPAVRPAG
jgi:hypothetical protein